MNLLEKFPVKYNDKKQEKEKEAVRDFFPKFVKKYAEELNTFSFGAVGTALTLFRDGYMDDTDIDMGIMRRDLPKLLTFIRKYNFKLGTFYVRDGQLCEVKILLKETSVDFFIHDVYEDGYFGFKELWLKGMRAKPALMINSRLFKGKLKLVNKCGIKVPGNIEYYRASYGPKWNVKIPKRADYINSEEYQVIFKKHKEIIVKKNTKNTDFGIKKDKKKIEFMENEIRSLSI